MLTASFPEKCISLVIIDTTAMESDLLKHAIEKQPAYEVLGFAKNTEEAVRLVSDQRPDVAIISKSEKRGPFAVLALLEELQRVHAETRPIILSPHLSPDEAAAYLRAQARGVVCGAEIGFAALCKCINCVYSGQIWADSEQLACLIESCAWSNEFRIVNSAGEAILSAREEEVLHLLGDGLTNRELAAALKLSEHTIKNHLFHIFDKLGVSSRMEAFLYAMNHRESAWRHRKNATPIPAVPSTPKREVYTLPNLEGWVSAPVQAPRQARSSGIAEEPRYLLHCETSNRQLTAPCAESLEKRMDAPADSISHAIQAENLPSPPFEQSDSRFHREASITLSLHPECDPFTLKLGVAGCHILVPWSVRSGVGQA